MNALRLHLLPQNKTEMFIDFRIPFVIMNCDETRARLKFKFEAIKSENKGSEEVIYPDFGKRLENMATTFMHDSLDNPFPYLHHFKLRRCIG